MLVELFALSGLYASGNICKYFYDLTDLRRSARLEDGKEVEVNKEPVEKMIELSVERIQQESPVYIHSGSPYTGFAIPISGGTSRELHTVLTGILPTDIKNSEYNYKITDFYSRPCSLPLRFWLNTPDDLKEYLTKNNIPHNSAPFSLPVQVREIHVPKDTRMYKVRELNIAGTHMDTVIHNAARVRSIGRQSFFYSAAFAVITGAFVWDEWRRGALN